MMLAKASARLGMVPAPAYLGPPPPNAPDATPPRLELDADAVGRTRAVYFDDDGQAQHVRNSHFSGDAEKELERVKKELERVKKEKDELSILARAWDLGAAPTGSSFRAASPPGTMSTRSSAAAAAAGGGKRKRRSVPATPTESPAKRRTARGGAGG